MNIENIPFELSKIFNLNISFTCKSIIIEMSRVKVTYCILSLILIMFEYLERLYRQLHNLSILIYY